MDEMDLLGRVISLNSLTISGGIVQVVVSRRRHPSRSSFIRKLSHNRTEHFCQIPVECLTFGSAKKMRKCVIGKFATPQ